MPKIATLATSRSNGHDSCPPVPAVEGYEKVKVNGSPILLVGHKMQVHGCKDHGPHQGTIAQGSALLKVNGIPVAMVGSQISGCPGFTSIASGDSLVNIER